MIPIEVIARAIHNNWITGTHGSHFSVRTNNTKDLANSAKDINIKHIIIDPILIIFLAPKTNLSRSDEIVANTGKETLITID